MVKRAPLILAIAVILAVIVVGSLAMFGGFGKDKKSGGGGGGSYNPPPVSKLTAENYLKIKEGMPAGDVELILGKANDFKAFVDDTHYTWNEGEKHIFIVCENGKVRSKTQRGLN